MATLPDDPVSRSYLLADLAAGLNPIVEEQSDHTARPGVDSGGVDVRGATIAVVDVAVREHPLYRTARYTLDPETVDLTAATYSIEVDGTPASVTGTWSTLADLLEALVDEANDVFGEGGANTADATVEADADGALVTVKITGRGEADFTFDGTAPGGVGLTLTADAKSCRVRALGRPKDLGAGATSRRRGWRALPDPATGLPADYAVGVEGAILAFPCGWLAAVHPYTTEIQGVTGDGGSVSVAVGVYVRPCVSIGTVPSTT